MPEIERLRMHLGSSMRNQKMYFKEGGLKAFAGIPGAENSEAKPQLPKEIIWMRRMRKLRT
jgi:hypothetical protein